MSKKTLPKWIKLTHPKLFQQIILEASYTPKETVSLIIDSAILIAVIGCCISLLFYVYPF
jgi:hypothetical protein